MRALGLVVIAALLAAGCASSSRDGPDFRRIKPKLIVEGNGLRVVKQVQGRAKSHSLFWIQIPDLVQSFFLGGASPIPVLSIAVTDPALREQAWADLHTKHDLLGNPQLLHNVTEEWTLANYLGLWAVQRLVVTADVVEFVEEEEEP